MCTCNVIERSFVSRQESKRLPRRPGWAHRSRFGAMRGWSCASQVQSHINHIQPAPTEISTDKVLHGTHHARRLRNLPRQEAYWKLLGDKKLKRCSTNATKINTSAIPKNAPVPPQADAVILACASQSQAPYYIAAPEAAFHFAILLHKHY